MMSLTHDATDTLPIISGAGYASMKGWWVISFIMSVVNLAVWGIAGIWRLLIVIEARLCRF